MRICAIPILITARYFPLCFILTHELNVLLYNFCLSATIGKIKVMSPNGNIHFVHCFKKNFFCVVNYPNNKSYCIYTSFKFLNSNPADPSTFRSSDATHSYRLSPPCNFFAQVLVHCTSRSFISMVPGAMFLWPYNIWMRLKGDCGENAT